MSREALLKAREAAQEAVEALDAALAALPPERGPQGLPVTPELIAELKRDEGLRLKAYPDPLSPLAKTGKGRGDPWTIGYGHTGPDVTPTTVWTEAKATEVLTADATEHNAELAEALPWACDLDPVRQRVLCNMAFNLGVPGLLTFKNTLAAVKAGDWSRAAAGMLASRWASQVGKRAERLVHMMKTGRTP